ncbi:MAG TPA: hypothetical protein VM425_19945 [Myxococcota bacterium]|nr:hypothetical protein [Myxococcota bacterium]
MRHCPVIVTNWLLALALSAAPARAAEGPIVAVFDVEDCGAGIDEKVLGNLTDYLSAMLIEGGYQVIPRTQIRERLAAAKKGSYKKCFDQSCQIELGRELAAQKSLATKVLKIGSECRVTGTLYDLKRAAAERAATVASACGGNDLLKAVEEIAHKLTLGNVMPEKTAKVEVTGEGASAKPEPLPEPEAKPEPRPAAGASANRGYRWGIALKAGLLFPGLGDEAGISLEKVGDLRTKAGSVSMLQVDYRPLRWLSLGLFGLFLHTEAEPVRLAVRTSTLNFAAFGARAYLRFFPAERMELRPGVSIGFGSFLGESQIRSDLNVDLQGSKGMATGLSLEYAWYFSDSFALLADLGFWSQALGRAGTGNEDQELSFKPLLYLSAGIEWGS